MADSTDRSWLDAVPSGPLSDDYGFSRGTPLDRRYIDQFLSDHRERIHGSVLELQDSTYTERFGGDRVSRSTVLDVDPSNSLATLIADLTQPRALPTSTYDCIILTQTLHLLSEPGVCIENCCHALNPGGSLLLTAPMVSRVSPRYPASDFWRFTPAGIRRLFEKHWDGPFTVSSLGNLRTCVGFLLAHTVEEMPEDAFAVNDPRFPLTVAVYAEKR